MVVIEGKSGHPITEKIKHIWPSLTDQEISCHEGLRDVFFLAIRKKYGLSRAQAEEALRNMAQASYVEAA